MVHRQLARATARELALWVLRRRTRVRVSGASMEPSLCHGDEVLVAPGQLYGAGDIVLARHQYRRDLVIIKRVAQVSTDGSVELRGDNPVHSTDSRAFGPVPATRIIGPITVRLRRAAAAATPPQRHP